MNERVEQLADLRTVGHGVAFEKFETELRAVLANIRNPNTEATAKRRVVLEFVFVPTGDRESAVVQITARSTLAATRPTTDTMWLAKHGEDTIATVVHPAADDPRQGVLPLTRKEGSTDAE